MFENRLPIKATSRLAGIRELRFALETLVRAAETIMALAAPSATVDRDVTAQDMAAAQARLELAVELGKELLRKG